jgi:uncharacterized Zn finger protein
MTTTWWATRFLQLAELRADSFRLMRSRSYTRGGQVQGLRVEPGQVSAAVQGSRPQPYVVTLTLKVWPAAVTALVHAILADRGGRCDGETPSAIEQQIQPHGVTLVPRPGEWRGDCACPDGVRPCKHVLAVCQALATAIGQEPRQLLLWRGLLAGSVASVPDAPPVLPESPKTGALSADFVAAFWAGEAPPDVPVASEAAQPVRLAGDSALTADGRPLLDHLNAAYRLMQARSPHPRA